MSNKLEGRVALVTGGTKGIGLSIAKLFAMEGAHVFVMGRNPGALASAVAECGDRVTGIEGNAADPEDLDRVYARIGAEAGCLDIVVANAGSGRFVPLGRITEEHVDTTFDLNVKGVLFTIQKALPLLRDGGSIVLISSITGSKGTPAFSVYGASKAAVRAFARSWMLDLKTRGIRVNVVSPGPTDTPGLTALAMDEDHAREIKVRLANTIPLGRLGRADEIAKATLFLASDDSSFINGVELAVDGGASEI
ncbi:SDR family NAD(P)-dependent oxidoreductase [Paraburkholderia caffeinilytica]|uniref:SDR family NAD(P)-dependent oxidoreductase n=1 Tax=Paraburkholderia caffeinilytica TaxID=1761016 RepID=UPI003DA10FBF